MKTVLVSQLEVYHKVVRLLTGQPTQQCFTTAWWDSNETTLWCGVEKNTIPVLSIFALLQNQNVVHCTKDLFEQHSMQYLPRSSDNCDIHWSRIQNCFSSEAVGAISVWIPLYWVYYLILLILTICLCELGWWRHCLL